MKHDKILKVLNMIAEDMENDVKHFEGQEFNGRNVSKQLGNQAAAIQALALCLTGVIEDMKEDK